MEKRHPIPDTTKSITSKKNTLSSLADHVPNSLRIHCVSVRLNNAELSKLNKLRGDYAKGEWLRMASLQKLPTILPPINLSAWKTLGEINQKLNRIALHINSYVHLILRNECQT